MQTEKVTSKILGLLRQDDHIEDYTEVDNNDWTEVYKELMSKIKYELDVLYNKFNIIDPDDDDLMDNMIHRINTLEEKQNKIIELIKIN